MSTADIRLAQDVDDHEAAYAFRYQVIFEEMKLDLPSVDHARRVLVDPEDKTGHLLVAYRDGAVVGTVRMNLLRDGPVEPHMKLLDRALRLDDRWACSVTTRLLVSAALRRSPLAVRLTQACYRYCRRAGVEWDYILVHASLVRMYTRLGYKPLGDAVVHPEIGPVYPMRLEINNEQHLRAIGSVFRCCWEDGV